MKIKILTTFAIAVLSGFGMARATNLGYDSDPLGTTGVGYAFWDTFSTINFANRNPDSSSGAGFFTGTLASFNLGGMVLGSGDRLYSGSGPTPNAFDLAISGTAGEGAKTIVLQLKFTSPSVGVPLDFYTISLAGVGAPTSTTLYGTSVESQTFNIVKYTWTGLNLSAGSTLDFGITSGADHVSLDGLYLGVSAVPEPHEYALGVCGLLAAVALFRRRRSALTA
jgi:hypothetical protein